MRPVDFEELEMCLVFQPLCPAAPTLQLQNQAHSASRQQVTESLSLAEATKRRNQLRELL